ncbi:hypothetical protein L3X38_042443 [Prunus dulcis]|uniref:SUF system FeS cluster assembly SufBD core domain-containing protein n=1 Tax=Prunus dulcis TaxID=3755 RepID=A0AAD4YLJ8_PRUDU|nr:hypothetical protein L3X38_042443 [Prunus dulcis]
MEEQRAQKGKNTRSRNISKGISAGNSRNCYRGLLQVQSKAENAKNSSQCDSMLIGDSAAANTYPYIQALEVKLNHRKDLQEVQLARTSMKRPGPLQLPRYLQDVGFIVENFGFSQITGETLPKFRQESRESLNRIY